MKNRRVGGCIPPSSNRSRGTGQETQVLSLYTVAHSFALSKKSTVLFSSNSALFRKNTRGWGVPLLGVLLNRRSPRPICRFKFFFFSRLSAFRNEPLAMR